VITCSSDRDPEREISHVRLLRSMRAAAVIFAGSGIVDAAASEELAKQLEGIRDNGGAIVRLSPHADGAPEVGVDNAAGVAAMVDALVGLGHRRIAFLAGPTNLYVARERLAGFRRALAVAGIPADDRLVVHTTFDEGGGRDGIDEVMGLETDVTAACCASDLLALGALRRLGELGIRVPDDISVAGFDDISVASLTAPHLSSVRIPIRELGRRGFDHAIRRLAGDPVQPELLPTEVVLRESTAAPARIPLATKGIA
jgi:LacI family transcriptional regulator